MRDILGIYIVAQTQFITICNVVMELGEQVPLVEVRRGIQRLLALLEQVGVEQEQ